jgi:tight adherence protein C
MPSSVLLAAALGAIGIAIVLLVIGILPARPGESGVAGALAAIERRYVQGAAPAAAGAVDTARALPGWLRALALRLSPSGASGRLQHQLDLAGNPDRWNTDRILASKGLSLVVFALIGLLFGAHHPLLLVVFAIIGGAVGFFLPDLLLYNAGLKRQALIRSQLPDAMDMLTVCVEAGLGFDAALAQVARNTTGPLSAELARALQEMQIGKTRTEALRSMADRTTAPELRSFVSALVQAGELGISIASVLREQAKEMRLRRRQRAEELAQKVPVKILFPLLLCLFPALFVVIMGPGVITVFNLFYHRSIP